MRDSFYEVVKYEGEPNIPEEMGHFRLNELAREIGKIVDTLSYNETEYNITDSLLNILKLRKYDSLHLLSRFTWSQFRGNLCPVIDDNVKLWQMEWWQHIIKSTDDEKAQTVSAIFRTVDKQ